MNQDLPQTSRRSAKAPSVARHGRLKRHGTWQTLAKIVGSVVAVTLVSGSAVAAYAALDLAATAKPTVTLGNEAALEGVPDVGAIEGGLNLLIIGSDSREGQGDGFGDPEEEQGVLNDVNLLLHISEDHSHASVVSFPRDMLVDVPGGCTDPESGEELWEQYDVKINSILEYGGMPCVVKTVEELTGVPILFAGIVQFLGAAAISEAVGGVDVCVAEPIEDTHTDLFLPAGMHELKGVQALQFLRTRYGVGDGSDLGRISNQQVFMSALARELQAEGTLTDPTKLFSIAKAALQNMQLSDSLMDPTRMISIAKAVKDTDLAKIAFIQYPTGYTEDGGALIPGESAEIVNLALQNDTPVIFDPAAQEASFASTADPNAPPPEEAPAEEAPAEEAPADPAAPAPTAEALPSDVTGQTAADVRCSAGRTLDDQ
ncbi:LCP family protein [Agromyces sp. H66]|uniref:LCP family protein n=1 Tax=Agromyces sp. H66 TaxID=2529859 RepID=UPI0010A9E0A3|nr:LCP family protein [Agromyces sp. H66]